jgi:Fem-1 family protein b
MDKFPASDDYDEIIHYDARHGHKASLEAYLKHKPECINKLYQYGESKWTVLLAACFYQHEEIVEMLVNQFKADIEDKGTIMIDDTDGSSLIVEGVSPLWTAAIVNNFNIVKFLVQYGSANVNHLTKDYSSPFRAACYNNNLEMARFLVQYGANPHQRKLHNYTNLMLVVYHQYTDLVTYLVDDIKCDLNQQDDNGRTALHTAVEHDFFEIAKFLIRRGALNICDLTENMTPLMWTALRGRTRYVGAFDGHCSDTEWIEARELLGSAYGGCRPFIENFDLAVQYLTLAFEARTAKNIPKHCSDESLAVFNNHRECQTLEDLNQLVSSGSRETLYFEALLIQKRLLGATSEVYHKSLRDVGDTFADRNQYDVCLRLWFYELDLRKQQEISLNKEQLRSFASLFYRILLHDKTQISMNQFCKLLTIMTDELWSERDGNTFNYNLVTLLHLLTISARLLFDEDALNDHKLSREDGKILIQHIRSIINKNYFTNGSGSSLLHLCCDENTKAVSEDFETIFNLPILFHIQLPSHSYPCLMTARLLVSCGIDVDAMDSKDKTPLHILTQNYESDRSLAIIDFLCNTTDVHMDFADINGNTPIEYSGSTSIHRIPRVKRLQQKMNVTSLKCRCAHLAKYGKLPYKECLSSSLVKFIQKH